ncbi:MAG: class I SAM-dependent methyltransferase [Chloroflexi bacterium]|nr:class I SAM-dependent methyltransferase [Chloroflexota bacterium]
MKLYDARLRRLVCIEQKATPAFWDRQWAREAAGTGTRPPLNGFVLRVLREYCPGKDGLILEGGCGMGQVVHTMQARGYRAIGVDFGEHTIRQARRVFPDLDLRVADVTALPFPDAHFTGYWSLGVIEHSWQGYQAILREMRRVLCPGGYAFVSFPNMSPLRKIKARLGRYPELNGGEEPEHFYQFILDTADVVDSFRTAGFRLVAKKPLDGLKGVKDEVAFLKPALQRLYDYRGGSRLLTGIRALSSSLLAGLAGHSVFLVFTSTKK